MNPPLRPLGGSDLQVTSVGLGTWAMGGGDWLFGWGPQDERESIATVHAALDAGINWIDTAAVYGFGRSEEVVGKALREWSGPAPVVATKCGRKAGRDQMDKIHGDISHASVMAECEDSLRRLGVEAIDLYQLHWPVPDLAEVEEGWTALQDLKTAGKIRFGGVSNFNPAQLRACQDIAPVTSLQPPYSLLNRGVEAEILPWCREHGVGVVAYSPMAKGMLTGKIDQVWVDGLPDTDHRKVRDPMFQAPRLGRCLAQVERLKPIAARERLSPAQLAIAWVTHQPGVSSAIVGARRPDQIRDTAQAMRADLGPETLQELNELFPA